MVEIPGESVIWIMTYTLRLCMLEERGQLYEVVVPERRNSCITFSTKLP